MGKDRGVINLGKSSGQVLSQGTMITIVDAQGQGLFTCADQPRHSCAVRQ